MFNSDQITPTNSMLTINSNIPRPNLQLQSKIQGVITKNITTLTQMKQEEEKGTVTRRTNTQVVELLGSELDVELA